MKCQECGKELKETDLICPKCGKTTGFEFNKVPPPLDHNNTRHDYDPNCALCRAERVEQLKEKEKNVDKKESDVLAKYDDGKIIEKYKKVKKLINSYEEEKESLLNKLMIIDDNKEEIKAKINDLQIMIEALNNVI